MQPVFLSILMKKGKGKAPLVESQSSYERRKLFSQKISINGETLDWKEEHVNIHDFAQFEKEEQLMPEFRLSIKSRTAQLARQSSLNLSDAEEKPGPPKLLKKKTTSFPDIARQVALMENVLLRWPRRPRTRHHSSSSEDCVDDDGDNCKLQGAASKGKIHERIKYADASEDESVHTETSDVESVQDEDTNNVEDKKVELQESNSNQNASDNQSCDKVVEANGTDTAISETDINSGLDVDEVKLDVKTESTQLLHEKGNVGHEHADPEKVKEITYSKDKELKKTKSRGRPRCPFCVIL